MLSVFVLLALYFIRFIFSPRSALAGSWREQVFCDWSNGSKPNVQLLCAKTNGLIPTGSAVFRRPARRDVFEHPGCSMSTVVKFNTALSSQKFECGKKNSNPKRMSHASSIFGSFSLVGRPPPTVTKTRSKPTHR